MPPGPQRCRRSSTCGGGRDHPSSPQERRYDDFVVAWRVMSAKSANGGGGFGPLETEVMGVVWTAGAPVPVREVMVRLNDGRVDPLAYTTVMTVMNRLADKGALARSPAGRSFVYEATAPDPAGLAVRSVIRAYGEEAITHFVDEARSDPKALRRLRALLEEE